MIKRIATALVLIPIVLLLVLRAPVPVVAAVTAIVALLTVQEFLKLTESYGVSPLHKPTYGVVVLFFVLLMKVGQLPLIPAFQRSLEDNRRYSLVLLELIQKMAQAKVSMRQVEGPIGIGSAIGHAVTEKGWTPLLGLTAGISLNLGIFNLLPIPILDGGVILLLLIEGLMRRDISLQIKERIYQAAFVFLVLFAVTVIYNDIAKRWPLGS